MSEIVELDLNAAAVHRQIAAQINLLDVLEKYLVTKCV